MEERKWVSNQLMFWNEHEWNEAYSNCLQKNPDFNNQGGTDQVSCMINYLMHTYPVSKEQLDERNSKIKF